MPPPVACAASATTSAPPSRPVRLATACVPPHFVLSGTVRGGLYGQPPNLTRLDGAQNARYTTDFRQRYSTVAHNRWGVSPMTVTRGRFDPVKFLHT